jgi:hypothetical protein
MTLSLASVSDVGTKSKQNLLTIKFELNPVSTLAQIVTASTTFTANPAQWYALGGLRQNASALQALIIQNELAIAPGYRIECQISEEAAVSTRARRRQTVYVRAVAI